MTEGGRQLDQVTAERLLSTGEKVHWQHVRDYDRQEQQVETFGSKTSHLTVVGLGWAAVVGTSVAKSLLDPSKRHLLVSHRLIHARIVAQWATIGALIAAGVGEKMMVSMYDSSAPPAAVGGEAVAPANARGPSKKEDWNRL